MYCGVKYLPVAGENLEIISLLVNYMKIDCSFQIIID